MPRRIPDLVLRDVPLLRRESTVGDALQVLLSSGLPALPVVDAGDRYAGVFGEREFLEALFPGYVGQLSSASFVTRSVEDVLEKRATCGREPLAGHLNEEHVEVGEDFADLQIAEVFLHHRVLIVPVVRDRRVVGVVTRSDFFRALADRVIDGSGG